MQLPETRLLRSLLRLHGHSPEGFSVRMMADGCACITGPHTASFYPGDCWTSLFLRHLHRGYFDIAPVDRRTVA